MASDSKDPVDASSFILGKVSKSVVFPMFFESLILTLANGRNLRYTNVLVDPMGTIQ